MQEHLIISECHTPPFACTWSQRCFSLVLTSWENIDWILSHDQYITRANCSCTNFWLRSFTPSISTIPFLAMQWGEKFLITVLWPGKLPLEMPLDNCWVTSTRKNISHVPTIMIARIVIMFKVGRSIEACDWLFFWNTLIASAMSCSSGFRWFMSVLSSWISKNMLFGSRRWKRQRSGTVALLSQHILNESQGCCKP